MPLESSSNAPSSAKTSAPSAAPSSDRSAGTPKPTLTESQFLAKQAADAKAAISNSLAELGRELSQTADPRAWMKIHPWATLGAAAVAGFAAAGVVVQSKEQQALNRLAKLEAALDVNAKNGNSHGETKRPTSRSDQPTLFTRLASMALHASQPLITSLIAGVTASMTAQPAPAAEQNGAPDRTSSPGPDAPTTDAGI